MKPVFSESGDGILRHSIPVEVCVTREEYAALKKRVEAGEGDGTIEKLVSTLIVASDWQGLIENDSYNKLAYVNQLLAACKAMETAVSQTYSKDANGTVWVYTAKEKSEAIYEALEQLREAIAKAKANEPKMAARSDDEY